MTDRYGTPPQPVHTLVQVTTLRRRAMASGISELIVMGNKLRIVGPPLPDSVQVRLARVYPKATYVAPARVALIPLPEDYTDGALVTWVTGALDALFPLVATVPGGAD
jgi:transcription-repair coupling factor (superfamily II helicase)